jgi:hypothetical protein
MHPIKEQMFNRSLKTIFFLMFAAVYLDGVARSSCSRTERTTAVPAGSIPRQQNG